MNRRMAPLIFGLFLSAACRSAAAPAAPPSPLPAFWKGRVEDVEEAMKGVKKGRVSVVARSPGGRPVYLVAYGEPVPRQGTANYGSACGGNDPASYARKDGTQKPVVLLLGAVHGQEFEGTVGLINLIRIAETGRDLRGREWKALSELLARCRILLVPCGNPDGRARCEYDSWVGEELKIHERVGMGVKPDGSNHTWPQVKRIHPMRGPEVARMGAYWNDDGVNFMHDDWFNPMAAETRAFLRLAHEEAPDFSASLHSHGSAPELLQEAYVPRTVKEVIRRIDERLQKRYKETGLPCREKSREPKEDGTAFPPPAFNLASALHHACGGISTVFETCVGVRTPPYPQVTLDQLLDIHLLLFEEVLKYVLENPVKWTK